MLLALLYVFLICKTTRDAGGFALTIRVSYQRHLKVLLV